MISIRNILWVLVILSLLYVEPIECKKKVAAPKRNEPKV